MPLTKSRFFTTAAALGTATLVMAGSALAQQYGDPLAAPATVTISWVGFAIFIARIIGLVAAAFFAVQMYFKRFDWARLAGLIGGLTVLFLSGPVINYFGTQLGGVASTQAIMSVGGQTYTPGR